MFKAPQPTKDEITIIAARPNVHLIAIIVIEYEKEHYPIEKATKFVSIGMKKQADCIAACLFIPMLTDYVAFSMG